MARVLVPLADGCEELEAVTVIDLLRRAGNTVVAAGLKPGIVRASRGVQLVPDVTLDVALQDEYDMVVLPGGMPGAESLRQDERVIALLRRMREAGRYTAAICAAPIALAQAGVLAGRRATSYPGFLDRMALPDVTYLDERVVQDGTVVTSRGPGTAMDFALTLIEALNGKGVRDQVEAGLARA
jgi:4-methyl-5(b-hydroxyethyl)-thiazole monophosphate biosynthesis